MNGYFKTNQKTCCMLSKNSLIALLCNAFSAFLFVKIQLNVEQNKLKLPIPLGYFFYCGALKEKKTT